MRKIVLMLLLLVASPAFAYPPTFQDQIHSCVETSVKFIEYAILADHSKDSEQGAFLAFVQQEADSQRSLKVKEILISLGQLAWATRGEDAHANAMDLYDKCYSKLGTLT